jgi:hypothetical protein
MRFTLASLSLALLLGCTASGDAPRYGSLQDRRRR